MASTTIISLPPNASEMLRTHTLATEIIGRNDLDEDYRILDDDEVSLLRRWCADPTAAKEILVEGEREGSLVQHLIRESIAGNELLTGEEFARLQAWFVLVARE